jgi:DNA repair protein RecO (recombination protein O)
MGKFDRHRAVVLKAEGTGESSRVLHLLTEDAGLVQCVARGAAKSMRRFGGCLEPFTSGTFLLRRGGRGRPTLEAVDGVVSRFGISASVGALAVACCASEWVLRVVHGGDDGREWVSDLEAVLDRVAVPGSPLSALLVWYEVRVLVRTGVMPDPAVCGVCGLTLGEGGGTLLASADGVLVHGLHGAGGAVVDEATRRILVTMVERPLAMVARLSLTSDQARSLLKVTELLAGHQVGFVPRSRGFAVSTLVESVR